MPLNGANGVQTAGAVGLASLLIYLEMRANGANVQTVV